MMRPPMDAYAQAMKPAMSAPPSTIAMLLQQEQNKLKQLGAKRSELQHHLAMIEQQILKIQGGMEVLQTLGKS